MLQKERNGYVLRMPQTNDDLTQVINEYKQQVKPGDFVGLDTETTGLDYYTDYIVGICISYRIGNDYKGFYLPLRHRDYNNLPLDRCLKFTNWILHKYQAVLFNRSFDFSMLEKEEHITLEGVRSHDVQVLCWEATYAKFPSLKVFYRTYCKKEIDSFASTVSSRKVEESETEENSHNFGETDPTYTFDYGALDPVATLELFFKMQQLFPYIKVIYPLDNKVSEVLRILTKQVYTIDYDKIRLIKQEQEKILRKYQNECYSIAGYQFKIGSSRQKAEALSRFVTLSKKTKKGEFEVSIPVLSEIDHPLARALVGYSETFKFINSYIDPLLRTEGTEFRINYKTVEAPTARIASGSSKGNSYYAPINIQSIPSEEETLYLHKDSVLGYIANDNPEGAVGEYTTKAGIRKAFKAPKGYVFMTFDYANEEMRIVANLSNEPTWINAIKNNEDLHKATAKTVFNDETKRKSAKTINFGILYGMSVYSLAARLKVSILEGKAIMSRYFQRLNKLDAWIKHVHAKGRRTMATQTYYGRVRPLSQYYNSSDPGMIGFADRSSVNTACQGCIPIQISFEMKDMAVKVGNPNNLKEDYEMSTGQRAVLSYRGVNDCFALFSDEGEFIVCDGNHKLFQKNSKTLRVINAVQSHISHIPVELAPLQKKRISAFTLKRDRAALKKIFLFTRKRDVVYRDKLIETWLWEAYVSNSTIKLPILEAANLRSICSVHGFNLVAKPIDTTSVECRVKLIRPKRVTLTKSIYLDKLNVCSATVTSGHPIYQAQGFENRNTAADVLRIKLCELYSFWKQDKEFHDNVIICWSVHDEVEFYVKEEYRAKAFKLIPQLMKVTHENWQVPLVVEGGIGYSWGTCIDAELDDEGKIVSIPKAKWYKEQSE